MKLNSALLLIVSLIASTTIFAQDPARFQNEVNELVENEFIIDDSKETVVFTGSSSIRMWPDVQKTFPGVNAINTGFGGSQFSDLIHFRNELIFKHIPDKIFIYEGDNDVSDGKSPAEIIAGAAFLYAKIKEKLPEAQVYFISPKPSIDRWHLQEEYQQTNELLKEFCEFEESITFVDVWNPMLTEKGEPKPDIFLEDDLHMNDKGYQIWLEIIKPYVHEE